MKKLLVASLIVLYACNSSQKTAAETSVATGTKDVSTRFAATITEAELKEHLFTYASDDFAGRETGQPGQKKAVEYLKDYYTSQGIPPVRENADYFQPVGLAISKVPTGKIIVDGSDFYQGKDFLSFSSLEAQMDEVVYVGYGIDDSGYTDYGSLDVRGKMVLVKSGEPKDGDGTYVLSGTGKPTVWSSMSDGIGKRLEVALEKGAKGMLYYDPDNFSRYKRHYDFMKNSSKERMELEKEIKQDVLILINDAMVAALYPKLKMDTTPSMVPTSMRVEITSGNVQVDSENVAALVRGSELPNEYIIISSHLDHIGLAENGAVNNGADDDGSGTVALLEVAEAFKEAQKQGNGPRRSVVFLHVTGEEKGLLGSRYYTDYDPLVPLEDTVANLNVDMIGRIDPKRDGDRNYIYLIGSDKLSTELHELSEAVNARYTNIELDYTYNDENDPNRFYYRSDHYNFAKNNIPIIFYFNGTHADYHQPSDTPDKINYDLLKNRTQLIFHTAWELANRKERVSVDKADQ